MKIIILGGDGFCGWPTTLKLSSENHEILIIDSFVRRDIDKELGIKSVTPISSLKDRLDSWYKLSGKKINYLKFDIAIDYDSLLKAFNAFKPDVIIHFAEQRAAPYSMKSSWHKRYTINNNINATNNVLAAIVEIKLDAHLVHLGTMGVYGYKTPDIEIPEGYLNVKIQKENEYHDLEILYPSDPGSIYHLSKAQDQLLFSYYNKNDGVRITDLHQGIVWGIQTKETLIDEKLINRFDYDGDFGTVLNRFIVQSVLNYPLTVHGNGGQTRAFININDCVECINLAVKNPPGTNERVKIMNQMTETHKIIDLAKLISNKTGVKIEKVENPRNENAENELDVSNKNFIDLGLKQTKLDETLINEISIISEKYKERIDKNKIPCKSKWR